MTEEKAYELKDDEKKQGRVFKIKLRITEEGYKGSDRGYGRVAKVPESILDDMEDLNMLMKMFKFPEMIREYLKKYPEK